MFGFEKITLYAIYYIPTETTASRYILIGYIYRLIYHNTCNVYNLYKYNLHNIIILFLFFLTSV